MMKWRNSRQSGNVEDRRAGSGFSRAGGFSRMGSLIPIVRFLLGSNIGRVILAVGAIAYFMGYNPLALLETPTSSPAHEKNLSQDNPQSEQMQFVSAVLAQTEDVWSEIFKSHNARYAMPSLVVFRDYVRSACGSASSQSGPFYCPSDQKIYLDLSFFDELARTHKAGGDFAGAYVIAHEVGHHVQNLQGILQKIHALKAQTPYEAEQNALQVRVELQADCYGGVWAHHIQKYQMLDDGDIDEALNAASAIGDDTLQRKFQGRVVPDSFTHGSSKQRMEWFKKGFEKGRMEACAFGI